MHLLFLSVLFASLEFGVLKLLKIRFKVNVIYAIVCCYPASLLYTILLFDIKPQSLYADFVNLWPMLVILGLLLVTVYMSIFMSVKTSGIVITVVAQRLSLALSVLYSIFVFKEKLDAITFSGVLLAFLALLMVIPFKEKKNLLKGGARTWIFPIVIFLEMGIIDIFYGYVAKFELVSFSNTLIVGFFVASITAPIFAHIFDKHGRYTFKTFLSGAILAVFNTGGLYFFTKALSYFSQTVVKVYISQAVGIVTMGLLIGIIVFKEKLRTINILGIALAIVSIWLLLLFKVNHLK